MAKTKHIHPTRIFREPSQLLEAWEEYKQHLIEDAKNWPKVQYVGIFKFIAQYFKNVGNLYDDFLPICSHIAAERRSQQITGGMLGHFNPSITQRLNGLKEQVEQTNIEQPLFPET